MIHKTLLTSAIKRGSCRVPVHPQHITTRALVSKTALNASEARKIISSFEADDNVAISNTACSEPKRDGIKGASLRPSTTGKPLAKKAPDQFVGRSHFKDFDLAGGVYIVTGGARGLGLSMAVALCEAGGKVYCLDRQPAPDDTFREAQREVSEHQPTGSLHYAQLDVTDTASLDSTVSFIADQHSRLDGLIAAAGIQQLCAAVDYTPEDAREMMDTNFTGVMMTATAAGRAMMKHKCRGSVVLIASMSGLVANKGLISPVYNASKAAVTQLARNLAMEWGRLNEDGSGGIRVNTISPGHIVTPMVQKNFDEVPGLREKWEKENMLGRLSQPEEFRGAGVFLLSKASSFMTGNNLVIDGGHTAW